MRYDTRDIDESMCGRKTYKILKKHSGRASKKREELATFDTKHRSSNVSPKLIRVGLLREVF